MLLAKVFLKEREAIFAQELVEGPQEDQSCDPKFGPLLPVFRVGHVFQEAEEHVSEAVQ